MKAVVIAHGVVHEAVARHMDRWRLAFDDLRFISPKDDPLKGAIRIGQSCINGPGSLERMKVAIKTAMNSGPVSCVMEYDTVFNCARLPSIGWPENAITCSKIFRNVPNCSFAAPIYGHSPWICSKETWRQILAHGDDPQDGFPDQWLALACYKAGVSIYGMVDGFSKDGPWSDAVVREAISETRMVYHGVKTAEVFQELTRNGWFVGGKFNFYIPDYVVPSYKDAKAGGIDPRNPEYSSIARIDDGVGGEKWS